MLQCNSFQGNNTSDDRLYRSLETIFSWLPHIGLYCTNVCKSHIKMLPFLLHCLWQLKYTLLKMFVLFKTICWLKKF